MFEIGQKVRIIWIHPFNENNSQHPLLPHNGKIVTVKTKRVGKIDDIYTVEEIDDMEINEWNLAVETLECEGNTKVMPLNTIERVLKKLDLESYNDAIKNKLESIGKRDGTNLLNNDDINWDMEQSLNCIIKDRIYFFPSFHTFNNCAEAIYFTNELAEKLNKEWHDIFKIVLDASGFIYKRFKSIQMETEQRILEWGGQTKVFRQN